MEFDASFRSALACLSADSMAFAISTAIFHVKSFSVNSFFWIARFLRPQMIA